MIILFPALIMAASVQLPETFQMPFQAQNLAEAQAWQAKVRARLLEIVAAQNPRKDTPMDLRVGEFADGPKFRKADVTLTGNEGTPIEATLTVPNGKGPFPAILCLHGHSGSREKVWDSQSEYKGFGRAFAERGFVTLTPSLWHCDYAPNQLWNLMRLVDVIASRPEVDASRIGAAGLSMGGEWTMWIATCDARIQAAVVSGWMCTTEGVLRVPNCPCWMPPGLLDLCDIAEVEILIAPRPLLFESAIADGCFPIDATRAGFAKVQAGYKVFGAEDKVRQHAFPGGHAWNGGEAYAFMEQALQPGGSTAPTAPQAP